MADVVPEVSGLGEENPSASNSGPAHLSSLTRFHTKTLDYMCTFPLRPNEAMHVHASNIHVVFVSHSRCGLVTRNDQLNYDFPLQLPKSVLLKPNEQANLQQLFDQFFTVS